MTSRIVVIDKLYDHAWRNGGGLRVELWGKPTDGLPVDASDPCLKNYIVAVTDDPFAQDTLRLAQVHGRPVRVNLLNVHGDAHIVGIELVEQRA